MSASRRAAHARAIESLYRLQGPEAARLYADRILRTGVPCPVCRGKGGIPPAPGAPPLAHGADDCPLCLTRGVLRPRAGATRERNEDFAIVHGNRP